MILHFKKSNKNKQNIENFTKKEQQMKIYMKTKHPWWWPYLIKKHIENTSLVNYHLSQSWGEAHIFLCVIKLPISHIDIGNSFYTKGGIYVT
jgi:hypothetical protein